MKIAFMFSGQGAQYAGMGKELYDSFPTVRAVYEEADEKLGFGLSDLCFYENDKLDETEYTQPAILTTSTAILRILQDEKIDCDYCLGLSLGEYSALVASGALDFRDAVELVHKRGRFMTEAVPDGKGTMYAILGLSRQAVADSCQEVSSIGFVSPANYNTDGNIVIAGETKACEAAAEVAISKGAKRAVKLNVSGPFHTPLLKSAADKMAKELMKYTVYPINIPIVANCTGRLLTDSTQVAGNLINQLTSPVYWEESIKLLIELGINTFVEIGPGKTLCSFARRINRDIRVCNAEDTQSIEKTLKTLKERS